MAENESLDLKSPHAQRWNAVRDIARKGGTCQKVVTITRKKLHEALRKVSKQFKRYGVNTADFIDGRGSPRSLRDLVRKTERHPYAELLVAVLNSNPSASGAECLNQWGHAVLDTVFDQIGHSLTGTEHFPSVFEPRRLFQQVRHGLEGDIRRIAAKLNEKPDWEPRQAATKRVSKEDTTAEMLPMSLLAGGNR